MATLSLSSASAFCKSSFRWSCAKPQGIAGRGTGFSARMITCSAKAEAAPEVDRRSLLLLAPAVAVGAAISFSAASQAVAEEGVCDLQTGASGLQYCDILIGSGYQPSPGDLIKAHYTGRLLNGTVFDTSYKRGKPLVFRIGVGEVIRGWDLGILGEEGVPAMLAGGKRTLRIPSPLAYGVRGAGCRGGTCIIPPDSDLIFEVELVGKA